MSDERTFDVPTGAIEERITNATEAFSWPTMREEIPTVVDAHIVGVSPDQDELLICVHADDGTEDAVPIPRTMLIPDDEHERLEEIGIDQARANAQRRLEELTAHFDRITKAAWN